MFVATQLSTLQFFIVLVPVPLRISKFLQLLSPCRIDLIPPLRGERVLLTLMRMLYALELILFLQNFFCKTHRASSSLSASHVSALLWPKY